MFIRKSFWVACELLNFSAIYAVEKQCNKNEEEKTLYHFLGFEIECDTMCYCSTGRRRCVCRLGLGGESSSDDHCES